MTICKCFLSPNRTREDFEVHQEAACVDSKQVTEEKVTSMLVNGRRDLQGSTFQCLFHKGEHPLVVIQQD